MKGAGGEPGSGDERISNDEAGHSVKREQNQGPDRRL